MSKIVNYCPLLQILSQLVPYLLSICLRALDRFNKISPAIKPACPFSPAKSPASRQDR